MKLDKTLGPDAGMFCRYPGLRFSTNPRPLDIPRDRADEIFIDQTSLVELVENLALDDGLAEAFKPFPIGRTAFSQHAELTKTYELPDGTHMMFYTLLEAYREGVLPEAEGVAQNVANMQVAVKERQPTQWWLMANHPQWRKTMAEAGVAFLKSMDRGSWWVATYDERLKDSFWETSMGRCLIRIEELHTQ